MKRFEIFFGIIKIPVDFISTVLAFLAAYQLRLITEPIPGIAKPIDYSILPTLNEYLDFSLVTALSLVVIFALGSMYGLKTTFRFPKEIRKIIIFCGIWAMVMITYFFFTRTFPFSRLAILYSWGLTLLFLIIGRALIRAIQKTFLNAGIGRSKLIFIGSSAVIEEIYKNLKNDKSYKILGIIGEAQANSNLKLLGSLKDLEEIIRKEKPHEIIQTKSELGEKQDEEILEFCELNHIQYRFIPDLLDVRRTNVAIETINGIPIISLKPTPLDGWGKVHKRALDIIGATTGFIIFSPIFLLTALAVKIDSKGPIFFSRLDDDSPAKRIGQYGKSFRFYKFRSMKHKTDNQRYKELADQNIRKDGPLVKIAADPRITKVGKFIRRYSIDELPQLWNVLIGHMSLVGPRPHLPEEVANYKRHHHFVLNIKPGLTGLAQISGRSDLNFEDEVKLDRFYIENWSIWLDLKIIFKTLFVVLKGYQE